MMKKIGIYIMFSISLFTFSCGGKGSMKEVCACEALFANMKEQEINYRLNDQMSTEDAHTKVMDENKAAYDKCIQLHKDMDDHRYFKLSQKCPSNK